MCQESAEEAIAELPVVDWQPSENGLPLGTQPLGDVVEGLFSHKEGPGDKMEKPVMWREQRIHPASEELKK